MDIVYFGNKRPKVIRVVTEENYPMRLQQVKAEMKETPSKHISLLTCRGVDEQDIVFEPFKAVNVHASIARKLLDNCGDIFFKVEVAERRRIQSPDHKPKTDGYVGDMTADKIPDLAKQREIDKKNEEGKSIEQVIDESKRKGRGGWKKKEKQE